MGTLWLSGNFWQLEPRAVGTCLSYFPYLVGCYNERKSQTQVCHIYVCFLASRRKNSWRTCSCKLGEISALCRLGILTFHEGSTWGRFSHILTEGFGDPSGWMRCKTDYLSSSTECHSRLSAAGLAISYTLFCRHGVPVSDFQPVYVSWISSVANE